MATTPNYASTPRIGAVKLSASYADTTGVSNPTDLLVGAAAGTRVERVLVHLAGNGTASGAQRISLWIWNGTTNFYYKDVVLPLSAGGNTATAAGPSADIPTPNLVLPTADYKLRVGGATSGVAADACHVIAFGADLT